MLKPLYNDEDINEPYSHRLNEYLIDIYGSFLVYISGLNNKSEPEPETYYPNSNFNEELRKRGYYF